MERTSHTAPIGCFGHDQSKDNPLCPGCVHRADCSSLMGSLANRVPVDEVRFSFVPVQLAHRCNSAQVQAVDPDLDSIEQTYASCHRWVFGESPARPIGKMKSIILRRAIEANTSIKLFFLANMCGWHKTNASKPFYTKLLTSTSAVKQVNTYASICRQKYGSFDISTIDRLVGSTVAQQDFEEHLYYAEVSAGGWILNYKMTQSGGMIAQFYADMEPSLHPYWLAIEETYYVQVLKPHLEAPELCDCRVLAQHRADAARLTGKLKNKPRSALAVFRARERIMPRAVRRVLSQRGFQPSDFLIEDGIVTNPFKFWGRLALAIQQFELLKLVDGGSSFFSQP